MSNLWFNPEEWLRLFTALMFGAAIGFERELHDKPAGLKTIATVTLAGCLLMLVSVHMGSLLGNTQATVTLDRIDAGILTGIGFIGAGTILQSRHHVAGVTTAAVIWLMTGVGMALGAGFYSIALSGYIFGWIGLSLDPLGLWVMKRLKLKPKIAEGEAQEHHVEDQGMQLDGEEIRPQRIGGTHSSSQRRRDR